MAATITSLTNAYKGQTCWIVGSGPSLRWLKDTDFEDGPVIAVNYATQIVETLNLTNPVYSMQKDHHYFDSRYPTIAHIHESGKDGWGDYVFDNPMDFDLAWNIPSLVSATSIANLWGCTRCVYLCCDAVTKGDLLSLEGGEIIAKPMRAGYLIIGDWTKSVADKLGLPIEWRTPYPA